MVHTVHLLIVFFRNYNNGYDINNNNNDRLEHLSAGVSIEQRIQL